MPRRPSPLDLRLVTVFFTCACAWACAATGSALAATTTFRAASDTWVEQARPRADHGRDRVARVSAGRRGRGQSQALLRFDVGRLDGTVRSATLRIWVSDPSRTGFVVRGTGTARWSERTRWANRPRPASQVATKARATRGWVAVDVTAVVRSARPYGWMLLGRSSDALAFTTRESGRAPQLVVVTDPTDTRVDDDQETTSGGDELTGEDPAPRQDPPGDPVDDRDVTAPTAVRNLRASAFDATTALVEWDPASDDRGVARYVVSRVGSPTTVEVGASATSALLPDLTPGATVTIFVRALDAADNLGPSATVSLAMPTAPPPPPPPPPPPADTTAPTVPGSVAATAIGTTEIAVTWTGSTDDVGVTEYLVYRSGTLVVTLGAAARSYTDAGRSPATTYSYTVRARDAAGNTSAHSAAATATTDAPPPPPPPDVAPDGANLPIDWDLGSLTGTRYFVSTSGDDNAAGTTAGAPLRTLQKAISKVGSGTSATIVVRGGTYREGSLTIGANRAIHVVAYPGELPVFRGDQSADSGWTTEGALRWRTYTPIPVQNGSGIDFINGQNLTGDGVGKFADQAWVGDTELRQVSTKGAVSEGTFWVDDAQGRIYLSGADVARGNVAVSDRRIFLTINGAGTTLEGLRIMRYSNNANDYGVVRIQSTAHGTTLRDVEVVDAAFISVLVAGSHPTVLQDALFDHVTIDGPNWMGISAVLTDGFEVRDSVFTGADPWDEFTSSPQSGAIKTSRVRHSVISGSTFTDNRSHVVWYDQSNYDVDIVGNDMSGNTGNGVFFEISDDLLLADNHIVSAGSAAVKLAGSSGLKVVNNTLVGGTDALGIYTDSRSKPGCSDPTQALCSGSYSSDRDTTRATIPPTLDWMPRLDLMINNIVASPSGTGLCGGTTAVCVLTSNSGAAQPIQAIIHPAEPARGIPQTFIDGNVYRNGASSLWRISSGGNYSSLATFTNAMAAAPVSIPGIDANSFAGTTWVQADGTPTASLLDQAGDAVAIPVDARINQYLPAGTRLHGATPR